MRKRGFSAIELLIGLGITVFAFLAAFGFFGLTRDLFLRLKNAEEETQAAAAALDKIRIDLLRAGSGLVGPISQGTVEGVSADGNSLLIYRLDEAYPLAAGISPGGSEAVLGDAAGLRPGREVCLASEEQSELRVISACAANTVFLSAPLEYSYPQDDGRLLLLEKTTIFLDEANRILRRKINASPPQPLMEDVLRFECGFEPESKLARAGIIPAGQQEKAYEVWVLPKNLRLARNVDPAE